jgi:hypothetical protein
VDLVDLVLLVDLGGLVIWWFWWIWWIWWIETFDDSLDDDPGSSVPEVSRRKNRLHIV